MGKILRMYHGIKMADLVIRKQKRNSNTAGFQLKFIHFTEESNNCTDSRQFRFYRNLIRDWIKNKVKLGNIPKSKESLPHGNSPYLEPANVFPVWVAGCRQNGFIITKTGILTRLFSLV